MEIDIKIDGKSWADTIQKETVPIDLFNIKKMILKLIKIARENLS